MGQQLVSTLHGFDGVAASNDGVMRMLGPIILAQSRSRWMLPEISGDYACVDAVGLFLTSRGPLAWRHGDHAVECLPGSALLLDLADGGELTGGLHDDGLLLLLPRRLVSTLIPGRFAGRVVPPSAALTGLRRLASALLSTDHDLNEKQARLAGRAVSELLTIALSSQAATGALATRREASLLDRVIAHVDDNLAKDLDAEALCAALHCSRSALYRATGPLGGVIMLINQRRLSAVHDRMCDPHEARNIGTIASSHGFTDPTRFSRSFRRRYGLTAAELRRRCRLGGATPDAR